MISIEARTLFNQIREVNAGPETPFNLEEERTNSNAAGDLTVEPENVTTEEIVIEGVRTLRLIPANAKPERRLIFIHGGAFVMMSPESHQRFAGHVARACRAETLIPDYSLAPEFPFPKALDETIKIVSSFTENASGEGRKTILLGESAGGALALAGAINLREQGIPLSSCLILMCPWLDLTLTGDSIIGNQDKAILLTERNLKICGELYLRTSGHETSDHRVSPLFDNLRGLPPIYCQAAEHDLLLDDSVRLSRNMFAQNSDMQLEIFPEMCHSFQFFAGQFPEAIAAIKKIGRFVDRHLD